MSTKKGSLPSDFFQVQRQQWKKSLLVFLVLLGIYLIAVTFIILTLLVLCGVIIPGFQGGIFGHLGLGKVFLWSSALALVIAALHFYDARKSGARYIRERMRAEKPDRTDRYHDQFDNLVEEIRISSGLPRVQGYVIPSVAINSMALMEADGTASVLVTEGLLSECTREELQAVVGHELAHILRGDAFYVTLVCSLVNFIERIKQACEPRQEMNYGHYGQQDSQGGEGNPFLYVAASISSFLIRVFSALLSRQREILSDAAAVELTRNPMALARAIYKAHTKYSEVGTSDLSYCPLFIVDPRSEGIEKQEGLLGGLFGSHPPPLKRIEMLAEMANCQMVQVLVDIRESDKERREARPVAYPFKQTRSDSTQAKGKDEPEAPECEPMWSVRDPKGKWTEGLALREIPFLPFFSPVIKLRNLKDGTESDARDFPQMHDLLGKMGESGGGQGQCPRCQIDLVETVYDGALIKGCPQCGGKLTRDNALQRILIRQDLTYSEELLQRAKEFKEKVWLNPLHRKLEPDKPSESIFCATCSAKLRGQPYSYQYFVKAYKCLFCKAVWFDADDLEILQILVEANLNKTLQAGRDNEKKPADRQTFPPAKGPQ